jgi:hypothetical protein
MPARDRANALRQHMAYEAARIMVEQDVADFERARRKAAERTGILDRRNWPSNELIQEAVLAQRRLFSGPEQQDDLERMRRGALEAMRTFERFSPRLVGNALSGAGGPEQGVQIRLFAERPEDVVFALIDARIPWQDGERTFRYSGGERRAHPVLGFFAGDLPIELVVLPRSALRNPPLDPVSERPDRGADIERVEQLIAEEPPPAFGALA